MGERITELNALSTPADDDLLAIVDVSEPGTGGTKKIELVDISDMIIDKIPAASISGAGLVELATIAETSAGNDDERAITPDGLAGSSFGIRSFGVEIFVAATALATGDGKLYTPPMPITLNGYNLTSVVATVFAKSTSGTPTIQIARGRQANATSAHSFSDMLSTRITIDANEYCSLDATTPAVIDTSYDDIATGDILRFDVDVAGTGATGLWVTLNFQLP